MTETKLALARETCGRCGGSGEYSYNQMDGTRCYGCMGKKVRLTKAAKVVAEKLRKMRLVKVADLKVGDRYLEYTGVGPAQKMVTITAIAPDVHNPALLKLQLTYPGQTVAFSAGKDPSGFVEGPVTAEQIQERLRSLLPSKGIVEVPVFPVAVRITFIASLDPPHRPEG